MAGNNKCEYVCTGNRCDGSLGCANFVCGRFRNVSQFRPSPKAKPTQQRKNKPVTIPFEPQEIIYFPSTTVKDEMKIIIKPPSEDLHLDHIFDVSQQYTILDLPTLPQIRLKSVDKCYITRYKNPWDFHIILDRGSYLLNNRRWKRDFPREIVAAMGINCFQSGLGLLRGFLFLLGRYMESAHYKKVDDSSFKTGDLVVCLVKRQVPTRNGFRNMTFGYRAVVINNNRILYRKITTHVPGKNEEESFLRKYSVITVYLLDTGETRVVEQNKGFLAPLPKMFTLIPPLALHCALQGISPVAPDWDSRSIQFMQQLITPRHNGTGHCTSLTVEFFTTKSPFLMANFHLPQPPFFVELTTSLEEYPVFKYDRYETDFVTHFNINTELIRGDYGIQWNPIPSRPKFVKTMFLKKQWENLGKTSEQVWDLICNEVITGFMDVEDEEKAQLRAGLPNFQRGLILHMQGQGNPPKAQKVDRNKNLKAMKKAFTYFFRRLGRQIIKFTDEFDEGKDQWKGNLLAIKLNVPDLRKMSKKNKEKKDDQK